MEANRNERSLARRAASALAAAALAFASFALAGPPAGTTIANQATGNATLPSGSLAAASNTVTLTTSADSGPTPPYRATLLGNRTASAAPGGVVTFRHELSNVGTLADTYTLSTMAPATPWAFGTLAIYADANADGVADSTTPVTGLVALAPGASFHFVVTAQVAGGAPIASANSIEVRATSSNGATITPNTDVVTVYGTPGIADCATVTKMLSQERGASPGGPLTVTLTYWPCDKARERVTIGDALPAGMRYVAGSGRWSGAPGLALTDAAGDRQGPGAQQIDFSAAGNVVTAAVFNIAANNGGIVEFSVEIVAGLPMDTVVANTANYVFRDSAGRPDSQQSTNTATYTVTHRVDLELTGERIPTAQPGATLTFNNLLTNRGTQADRFDITLGSSTFPQGTVLTLFQADGVTPLADTDGNGTPDTGLVAPDASYRIVVRALLPTTTLPGTYKVTKTARSATSALRSASADDVVDAVGTRCEVAFDPDNQSTVGRGARVVYTHYITNRGNCDEDLAVAAGYITNDQGGWTATAFVDNPAAGGASIVGALDPTDTPIVAGWTTRVAPGAKLRILVEVVAPATVAPQALKAAAVLKDVVATNTTTLTITASASGGLTVRDTTIVDDKDGPVEPANAIRNFTDASHLVPTTSVVTGRSLFLRADAAACNTQPTIVESRTVLITGPGGELQLATATETGPDTGIFVVPALPVRDPPVAANDGVLQGRANDVFEVDLQGCGRTIATAVTLIVPRGVVFDSATNLPVAEARVALVAASPAACGTASVATGNTGANGQYAFTAQAPGWYCLAVQPPNGYAFASKVPWTSLAPGRNLSVTGATTGGSYGTPFESADGLIVVDVPVDPVAQDGLFVRKAASRAIVELGEFVDYSVRVRNNTGNALDRAGVQLVDDLPAGFAYVKGTARRNGERLADPVGGSGPRLVIDIGAMTAGQDVEISYRVRVGPGAMQGDGVNRVQATYTAAGVTTNSNVSSVKVTITGGVFSDRAYILGKVYLDCNANGVQDKGELGVPGVRLFIEDGTFVVTDGEGKYSFYGITNRTHILKADRTTLPAGATFSASSARNLGDGGSRIVDLKAGELHRGDFALAGCDAAVVDEVNARAKAIAETGDPLAGLAGTLLATETRAIPDVKALPAAGIVSTPAAPGGLGGQPGLTDPAGSGSTTPYANVLEVPQAMRPTPAPRIAPAGSAPTAPKETAPLEDVLPTVADNKLGFLGMADGDVLPSPVANVRVKGTAGSSFKLTLNGADIPGSRIGKRSTLADKQLQAWEYIGVTFATGENTLVLSQLDQFGNARGAVTIKVLAPGKLARIDLAQQGSGIADGKTPAKVVVKLSDENGTPVTARTPITLDAVRALWQTPDLDPNEPGLQAFVEGGQGTFLLASPLEPGSTFVAVSSGNLRAEARVDFLPEMRSLIAAGVIEGIVNIRNINSRSLVPTREADGFERELRHLSKEWDDGKNQAGARAAFFLKGKIKGDILLTAAYDSDKDSAERLFRDIQPDEFYPVYGDAGVRGFDAQSTSKLYLRADKGRSYLLYGDFTTQSNAEARKLSNYSRSLTGGRAHYENERVSATAFASRDSTRQVIDELRANGTSGPYQMGTANALVNSEKVEIITRDRNQPSIILQSVPQSRFSDYEIEPLTGRILFRSPVSSVDKDLNPVFVRITYEVDQGGEAFWAGGVEAQFKVTENIEVGGVYVEDKNPQLPFKMAGANATVKLGENLVVMGEIAQTDRGEEKGKGEGARVELKYTGDKLKAQAFAGRTDAAFDNPGSYLGQGRSESGGRLEWQAREGTTVRAEALRTEDVVSGSVRDGVLAAVTQDLGTTMNVELGVRHAREKGLTSPIPIVPGLPVPEPMPDEVTTVRARLTGAIPQVEGLSVYGEAEVDVTDTDRRILAAGGEYVLPNRGRIYARHEFVSSITGPYGLNSSERQNTTAVGIDTDYMKDGRLFSEYRIRDAMSGGDTEAAIGLKNLWTLAPGLRLGTTIERVHALSGTGQNENSALAVALEYTANPLWKGTTRLELRDATNAESLLFTVGAAVKLNDNWTALARNAYSLQRTKASGELPAAEREIERLQAGLAWRDTETNQWNALARVEHRLEEDSQREGIALKTTTDLISVHADWQPVRPFLVTGRYAAKWSTDKAAGLTTKYRAQLVGGRVTWEFAPKWDIAMITSVLFGDHAASRQYGVGLELGYLLSTNLWVSAGYNFFGYKDDDLAGADYTQKGPYVRLRYKFDEQSLEALAK